MTSVMTIDLSTISRELKKPVEQIETAVKLLDEGNTIPFITRFRKDQTGGLNEEQLLVVKQSVTRLRALADRRAFILKSIESQDKLTDKLKTAIEAAGSSRELEDLYLPYKPKKQSLATVARQNGLEPLANDIYEGREPDKDLASRATDFVRVDKNLNTIDDVILGVGHILAERFSDHIELRNELREIIHSQGKLSTRLIAVQDGNESATAQSATKPLRSASPQKTDDELAVNREPAADTIAGHGPGQDSERDQDPTSPTVGTDSTRQEVNGPGDSSAPPEPSAAAPMSVEGDASQSEADQMSPRNAAPSPETDPGQSTGVSDPPAGSSVALKKKRKKKKKKSRADDHYKEFQSFSHPIATIPYHKTLAINRGEKNGRIRVRIEIDESQFLEHAYQMLVPVDHPFAEFLKTCVKDSMARLMMPSLEREVRREITEAAEKHAVRVFARNLKNLLLQSPVRNQNVLAIDPGYKRGCSVAIIDSHGQLLEHAHVFVVGNQNRLKQSGEKLKELINKFGIQLIAIGNGAACREAEQLVSDLIAEHFPDGNLKYAVVNEAGASVYSTSEVGREELPEVSPTIRSAVSIGRRLIDPLSELVKISPAHIGVGLYQHDVKAKHLAESLDDVVQFCVNRVGVDVNTASPSLLRYVSGLNQLTARRVYEFRKTNGPFRNREQLKQVAGFGDATFIQSAGFLRIHGGDQPLDATSVHPESYPAATRIFEKVGSTVSEVFPAAANSNAQQTAQPVSMTGDRAPVPKSAVPQQEPSTPPETDSNAAQAVESSPAVPPEDLIAPTGDITKAADPVEADVQQPPVEPETSPAARFDNVSADRALTPDQLSRRKELVSAIRDLNPDQLVEELQIGQLMLRDILNSICRPEYDPRSNINRPVFRSGIIKIADLKKDMCLDGQVVNVVDFGVFVDIGLGTSCLVHVSQLANHFIRDPHRFFSVGDSIKVWVTDIDSDKRRVSLTAVQPASLRPKRREKPAGFRKRTGPKSGQRRPERKSHGNRAVRPKRKPPKKAPPITEEMLKGAEPMRSFSDLAQFYDKQSKPEDKKGRDGS